MLTLLLLLKIDGDFLTYLNTTWGPGMKPKKGDSVKQQQQKSFTVCYSENPEWFSTLTLKPEGDIN